MSGELDRAYGNVGQESVASHSSKESFNLDVDKVSESDRKGNEEGESQAKNIVNGV